jgi:hypothetical protein
MRMYAALNNKATASGMWLLCNGNQARICSCKKAPPVCTHSYEMLCVSAGAAFLGTQLLTVGEDGNIAVWSLHSKGGDSIDGKQCQLQRQRAQHPDLNVTMRSWLQRPAAAATSNDGSAGLQSAAAQLASPTAGAGAVVLPELQAAQRDPGEPLPERFCSRSAA